MKKIFTITFGLFISTIFSSPAQLLNYSTWEMYNSGGAINFYFYFNADTLLLSFDNITYSPRSTYQENSNSIQVIDIQGPGACQLTEIGLYTFTIQNDTLVFTTVSDPCVSREAVLANNYGVRLLNAVAENNVSEGFNIISKPDSKGVFILSTPGNRNSNIKTTVYSSDGKKVFDDQCGNCVNHEIDLSQHRSGMYLISVESENNRFVRKVLLGKR